MGMSHYVRLYTCGVVSLLMLAACTADSEAPLGSLDAANVNQSEDADSEQTDTSDQTDTAGFDAGGDSGGEVVPLIHEAELCDIPDNPALSVIAGTDLMKVTLESADAICNDGSPAVLYVRPAPAGSANANRWIVWLDSGGGCNSPAACAARWCGEDGYSAGKMSSTFAPDGIRGNGIFADRPDNSFADWNHVVAYYCSSDGWTGRKRTRAIDESGDPPPYELYLHGAFIVDEMIQTLKAGAVSDDGLLTMPSINDASMFVLAGTSAGSGGARANADRVGDILRETNAAVDYRLVVDAGAYPVEPHPPELSEADVLAMFDFKHEVITNWRDGVTDESCLVYHEDDPEWCAENSHLMFHHITTPTFVKMDLRDAAPGPYPNAQTFSAVMFEWYSDISAGNFVPEEPDVAIDSVGLFVPNCDHHLNLNVSDFYEVRISNGTDELSMHDLLSNWLRGTQPSQAIHNPNAGFSSVCP